MYWQMYFIVYKNRKERTKVIDSLLNNQRKYKIKNITLNLRDKTIMFLVPKKKKVFKYFNDKKHFALYFFEDYESITFRKFNYKHFIPVLVYCA